jgi:hypothetical protein
MNSLELSPQEFRAIVRVCQRVLINTQTPSLELRQFLVTRLSESFPETATRIEGFDERQMQELRQEVLDAVRANAESALWA